jgi:hypothetical protein
MQVHIHLPLNTSCSTRSYLLLLHLHLYPLRLLRLFRLWLHHLLLHYRSTPTPSSSRHRPSSCLR